MRTKKSSGTQLQFLSPTLSDQLNPKHRLYQLAEIIDRTCFEEEFKDLYSVEEG